MIRHLKSFATSFVTGLMLVLALASPLLYINGGCRPDPAQSAVGPSREAAIAFASAVAALEVLDVQHAQRMASIVEPTSEQIAWATSFSDRLHRLRDALVVTRSWLEGQADDKEGRASFRAAGDILQLLGR